MRKEIISAIFAILLIFAINNYSRAATASIQCSSTVEVNTPITISVTGSAVQWNLTLKVNGQSIASNSELDNVEGNKTISFSGRYTPISEGNLTVTLEGSVTEASNGSTIKDFGSKTITVTKTTSNSGNTNSNSGSNSGNNSNAGSNSNTGNNNSSAASAKSSNANVKEIKTSPVDFSGFRSNKTSGYAVDVENDVDKINVNVIKEDSKASVSLLNKTNSDTGKSWVYIAEGNNEISVIITAEDGKTKKTYTINVNRKAKEEQPEEPEQPEENSEKQPMEENFGLTELAIQGLELNPQFQTDIYEYRVELKESLEKLDITTLATKANSNIEITGNENFQEGENIITIIVKGENEAETVAYQIIVNKILEKQEEQEDTLNKEQQDKMKKIIILSVTGGIILLIVIAIAIVKIKKSKELNGGYMPYEDLVDNYEEDELKEKTIENIEENNQLQEQMIEEDEEDEFYEEEPKKKKHSKGKRFK